MSLKTLGVAKNGLYELFISSFFGGSSSLFLLISVYGVIGIVEFI